MCGTAALSRRGGLQAVCGSCFFLGRLRTGQHTGTLRARPCCLLDGALQNLDGLPVVLACLVLRLCLLPEMVSYLHGQLQIPPTDTQEYLMHSQLQSTWAVCTRRNSGLRLELMLKPPLELTQSQVPA